MFEKAALRFFPSSCLAAVVLDIWKIGTTNLGSRIFIRAKHRFPTLNEADLEEKFVRSGGPGGQNVNKRSTCVQLKHVPTGITVKCQEERSQEQNRERARRMIQERLDIHFNGPDSVVLKAKREHLTKMEFEHREAKSRLEMKRAFKRKMAESEIPPGEIQPTEGDPTDGSLKQRTSEDPARNT